MGYKKLLAQKVAKNRLFDMKNSVLEEIEFFINKPIEITLKTEFLPWLYEGVILELKRNSSLEREIAEIIEITHKTLEFEHNKSFIRRKEDIINKNNRKNNRKLVK